MFVNGCIIGAGEWGSRECAGAAREGKNTRDEDTRGQIKNNVIHALATLNKLLVSGTTFCFAGTE